MTQPAAVKQDIKPQDQTKKETIPAAKPEDKPQQGSDIVKESLAIARGEKEPPKESKPADSSTEAKPSKGTEEPKETKEEATHIPEGNKQEIEKIRKEYETQLEQERREKKGIYEDLKKSREKLQQLQVKPKPPVQSESPSPANVDNLISSATTALKEIGFSDKNIEELKERAIDDPFSVIAAISFAIPNHIKNKTLKELQMEENSEEEKNISERESIMVREINEGWESTREELAKKHSDMIKKGTDGKWVIDENNPKFKIYDEEAKKALAEEPWLRNSPRFAALVAQRMEMRILADENFAKGQESELNRQERIDAGFVAPSGRILPPKVKVELTEEEAEQADKDIRRGLFKSREEWAEYKNKRFV